MPKTREAARATLENLYRIFTVPEAPDSTLGAIDHAITEAAAWYCWHASRRQAMVEKVWEEFGAFVHQQIIWVKDRPIPSRSWYLWQHEPCFFGWIRGKKCRSLCSATSRWRLGLRRVRLSGWIKLTSLSESWPARMGITNATA